LLGIHRFDGQRLDDPDARIGQGWGSVVKVV
jgi:hypothetical protein